MVIDNNYLINQRLLEKVQSVLWALNFAIVFLMREFLSLKSNLLHFRLIFITSVILFLSQSPCQAVERIDIQVDPQSLPQLKAIDQSVASLLVPHFFNFQWDARDSTVEILSGFDMDTFALRKASHFNKVYTWNQCQNIGIFLVSYPQYLKGNSIDFHLKYEALIRINDQIKERISIPPQDELKTSSNFHFSNDCNEVFFTIGTSIYRINLNSFPKLEELSFRVEKDSKVFKLNDGRLAYTRKDADTTSLVLASLNNKNPELVLDQSTESIKLDYYNHGILCWVHAPYSKIKSTVKCWSEKKGIQANQISLENIVVGTPFYHVVSPQHVIVNDQKPIQTMSLIQVIDSKVIFESKFPFVLLNDNWLAILEKYGIGDTKLKFFNYKTRIWGKFSYNFLSSGDLIQYKVHQNNISIVTRNSYKQMSFFTFNKDGLIVEPYRFPEFNPPTQTQLVQLKAIDEFENFGYLVTSTAQKQNVDSAILYVHGGGCHLNLKLNQSMMIEAQALDLARSGIPVLSITYRNDSLPGREENSTTRNSENCGVEELDDIESGARYLRSIYPNAALFLWGRSHGGYLVNVMATHDSRVSLFNGVISEVGVWGNDFGRNFIDSAKNHYNPKRAPILFFEQLKIPMLIYHGRRDTNADYHLQIEPILKMMEHQNGNNDQHLTYRHSNKPLEAIIARDEEHDIKQYSTHLLWVKSIISFIKNQSKDSKD